MVTMSSFTVYTNNVNKEEHTKNYATNPVEIVGGYSISILYSSLRKLNLLMTSILNSVFPLNNIVHFKMTSLKQYQCIID